MRQPTILLLWSYRSDEVTTVTLVSRLRDAGLRVKLIGLDGRSCAGRVGLVLKADRTLAEWLATAEGCGAKGGEQLTGLILPFDDATLQRFAQDERFLVLLQHAQQEQALIILLEGSRELFQTLWPASVLSAAPAMSTLLRTVPITPSNDDLIEALIQELVNF